MTENGVTPSINNDPMEKRNEFIDHPSYIHIVSKFYVGMNTPPKFRSRYWHFASDINILPKHVNLFKRRWHLIIFPYVLAKYPCLIDFSILDPYNLNDRSQGGGWVLAKPV